MKKEYEVKFPSRKLPYARMESIMRRVDNLNNAKNKLNKKDKKVDRAAEND